MADNPSVMEEMTLLLGKETTNLILDCVGGQRLYVPKKWRPGGPFGELGEEVGRKLCEAYNGECLEFPNRPMTADARKQIAREMKASGAMVNQIARRLGCTERHARRLARPVQRKRA